MWQERAVSLCPECVGACFDGLQHSFLSHELLVCCRLVGKIVVKSGCWCRLLVARAGDESRQDQPAWQPQSCVYTDTNTVRVIISCATLTAEQSQTAQGSGVLGSKRSACRVRVSHTA